MDKLFGGPVAANDNLKACARCGKRLSIKSGPGRKAKFCGDDCRYAPAVTRSNCSYCAKPIVGRKSKRFCDARCRNARNSQSAQRAKKEEFERVCIVCGEITMGNRQRKFCSEKCSRSAYPRSPRDRHATAPDRVCEHCNSTFKRHANSHDAARFCSRKCGYDAGSNVLIDGVNVQPSLRSAALKLVARFKVAICMCRHCGTRFRSRSIQSSLCSDACKKARYVAANDNVDRSIRSCVECAVEFAPKYGDKNKKFCGTACSKRHSRRASRIRRKAAIRSAATESVNPIIVFERDKWRCQICKVLTPRSLRGTYDDRAPELDHIMPLSLGGAHSYMNTQCLCRKCNALKRDTPPSQLSLFAFAA